MKQYINIRDMPNKKKITCPFCKVEFELKDLKDEISRKEARISNLCQSCQDKFFEGDWY